MSQTDKTLTIFIVRLSLNMQKVLEVWSAPSSKLHREKIYERSKKFKKLIWNKVIVKHLLKCFTNCSDDDFNQSNKKFDL